ncbi:hypothetical protein [Nocardia amamiensis]|uniref:hypothetical protein n=1 Tax=Nocardia amamiensis TaxID=404578 RepID=UPI00082C7464|nr:hypothetical protein [Nocardia amamiensis]
MNANPAQHRPFGCVVEVARTPRSDPKDEAFAANLTTTLLALVPTWIATVRDWTTEQRQQATTEAAHTIASHGDALQFGGKKGGHALDALARGLALLAHAEGGVTALGIHACIEPHDSCPGLQPRPADQTDSAPTDSSPATAPVVALRVTPAELEDEIRKTLWTEDWCNPGDSNQFADTADWNWAWPVLLATAAQEADNDDLLIDPATGHPVTLIAPDHDSAADGPPITVEIHNPDTGRVLATHTYTGPLPVRPGRTDPGTQECAAADAVHALLTVLSDLNRAAAASQQ